MARHRDVASSPVRTAADTWGVIGELISVTLDRSDDIDGDDVRRVLADATPAGTALVAADYTGSADITVVAGPLYLTIRTVAGADAFETEADENHNPVPGAATAKDWTVYLPNPAGLASLVEDVAAASEHLSTDSPPAEAPNASSSTSATIDLRRLDPSRRA